MSYHDLLTKSEWAWIHSTEAYNNSEDSILTKATRAHQSQGVARSTRSRTQKRMAGQDEMFNVLKAEERAHRIVNFSRRDILPSFLNYREVCAQLLIAMEERNNSHDRREETAPHPFGQHQHLPIAITERHIKFWLVDHTGWILRDWDGSCEQMRNAIDDGAYQGKPYMLYAGNREYRHKLHKKLGSNFSHASVNLDDGSRVMIIVNNPGYIYTYNDHAVCFFEYSSNFYSRKVAAAAAALEQQVRSALDKMYTRGIATFLPQQQYESKSAADERKAASQTLDKWRERANQMINELK